MITIVLPVSRKNFLDRVFASLNALECDSSQVNLLVNVDGPPDLFEKARNLTVASKFHEKLCVYGKKAAANSSSVTRRRQRIADLHNMFKGLIHSCDYIFLTEDDTLLPTNALQNMLDVYAEHPDAGFITGVQLGRWGYTTVGIYKIDGSIESQVPNGMYQEIDAAGFYCLLTKKENYIGHEFKSFENILGPDFEFGYSLKKKGLQSYVDWSIKCTHMTLKEDITVQNSTIQRITFRKQGDGKWSQTVDKYTLQ